MATGFHNLPHYNTSWLADLRAGTIAHSDAIEEDLRDYEQRYGEPFRWIVGNAGKPWIASQNDPRVDGHYVMGNGADPLYGFHYDEHTKPLAQAPLHTPETPDMAGKHWVVQQPWNSSHKHHKDYSSTGIIATDTEPDEYVEIDPDSGIVTTVRTLTSTSPPPDTVPGPPPWHDPELTLGERKLLWLFAQRDAGVCEQPDGSNNGPEISEYHAITLRDGQPGFGRWLARAGGNWCASSASAADVAARLPDDPEPALTPRASGLELERDAKAAGTWRPSELAATGAFTPEAGDIATMQRGAPGTWRRHVVTVIKCGDGGVWCIGGNERNRFGADRFYRFSELLGFVEVPGDAGARFTGEAPYQGEDEAIEMPAIHVSADPSPNPLINDGDNALEGWHGIDPDDWSPDDWHGADGAKRRWKITGGGIVVRNTSGPMRTRGEPITVSKIWSKFEAHFIEAAKLTGVGARTLVAMVATESRGSEEAERFEAHLRDWSFGVAQTLTATAFEMAKSLPITAPRRPVPSDPSTEHAWRRFLFEPRHSILIGARYIAYNDRRWRLRGDPVLAYAAYNAGSPRANLSRPWGLHYTAGAHYDALDVFAKWYGDACAAVDY